MDKTIVIRPMKVSEATKVARLAKSIISSLSYYTPVARKSELKKYGARKLGQKVKADKFSVLLASVDSKIVGFLLNKWDDETIWAEWIGVSKQYRRQGIARLLMKELEQTLPQRNAHKIWCDCRTTNLASIRLLKSLGYEKLVTIPNHWFKQDYILWHKVIR
jgi:ribosomal protein S18 acetylase RimI-like enzyme